MTSSQLWALTPLLIATATIVAVMLTVAVKRHHRLCAAVSVIGTNLALLSLLPSIFGGNTETIAVTGLMQMDSAARFGMALVLVTTLGVLTLCHAYFEGFKKNREEVYLLIGLGTLGGLTLACATHASTLLLGVELLSLPMVAGVAYAIDDRRAIEGGLKYLILSAGASASLLFGIALIYAQIGSLDIDAMAKAIATAGLDQSLVLAGTAMMLAGLGFKLSLVPFHQWTPDVYEAAPTPIAAYMATVSKLGVFIVMLRLFHSGAGVPPSPFVLTAIVGMSVASMLIGSILALRQNNLKRLLAYSSIAHFGYLAIVLVVPGEESLRSAGVYLATYLVTSLGVFGVMALVSSPMADRDQEDIADYRGLFWRRPYLTSILTTMLLSLAGIPLTAGFIGKFSVIAVGVEAAHWVLVGSLVVSSAISIYYYLRVMSALFSAVDKGSERVSESLGWAQSAGGIMLLLAMLAMLWMGVYPQPLFHLSGQLALH
jgi:NADH-quinone oxidoreductase subunit N